MMDLAPDVHERLENMKIVYDMKAGDAIIHDRWRFISSFFSLISLITLITLISFFLNFFLSFFLNFRWCFHRSDFFKNESFWPPEHVLNRYSIRYMPEDARVFDNNFDQVQIGRDKEPLKAFGDDVFPLI